MTQYLTRYREYILACLEDGNCDYRQLLDYHTEKLHQFQHERLIHWLVTMLVGICTVMLFTAIAVWQTVVLIPLALILLVLLCFYLKHYYFLENTVQLLYKDYDAIYRKVWGFSQEDKDGPV
ncbi:MAG: hypothetical protein IJ806_00105 [Ruminococcus sp.]|nr:hypothetical protein [Ruminococcus sp.]